jgi:chromosome partitioning protein
MTSEAVAADAVLASAAAPTARGLTFEDIEILAARLGEIQEAWQAEATQPTGVKQPPSFGATQLGELLKKSPDQMSNLFKKAGEMGLSLGKEPAKKGGPRSFTLAEARAWVQKIRPFPTRPEGAPGATVTVCNFKGGVGKTVISAAVAQGLSLRGYKVLCIDFDPQGSLSSLLGVTPTKLDVDDTVAVLMAPRSESYAKDTLQECIRPTYWDGIDIVPGTHGLFAGEFYLPFRAMNAHRDEPGFRFYEVLNEALNSGIRDEYDYIIIDTPPSLSYMVLTTFYAADALLLPLPPEGIDFASSAQFWGMLAEIASSTESAERRAGTQKKSFGWIRVVPSKVDNTKLHANELRSLMKLGYANLLANTEIPETAAVRVGGARLDSVYDITRYIGDRRTLLRAREAYDRLVDEVDFLTHRHVWNAKGAVA